MKQNDIKSQNLLENENPKKTVENNDKQNEKVKLGGLDDLIKR